MDELEFGEGLNLNSTLTAIP
uniref:Uncharacterized protein n=1 Tax=Anguilla anguilla TaxID=7936 RepID=A0A0E9UT73_ANGAN